MYEIFLDPLFRRQGNEMIQGNFILSIFDTKFQIVCPKMVLRQVVASDLSYVMATSRCWPILYANDHSMSFNKKISCNGFVV